MSCRKSIFKQFLNLALPGCATDRLSYCEGGFFIEKETNNYSENFKILVFEQAHVRMALPGCATANQKRPILVRAFQTSFSNGE